MILSMSRSFWWGTFVASATWCFSLYLYWLLTRSPENHGLFGLGQNRWPNMLQTQEYVAVKHSDLSSKIGFLDKRSDEEEQKQNLYIKYKKEKKFQKISQRLIDELKPIEVTPQGILLFHKCFLIHRDNND